MKQNFFPTLGAALDAVREYLVASKCELTNAVEVSDFFGYGGVGYGDTKHNAFLLSVFKGKPVTGRRAPHALSVTIYRMGSGTYECIAYVS
jgi:hypothetical protein